MKNWICRGCEPNCQLKCEIVPICCIGASRKPKWELFEDKVLLNRFAEAALTGLLARAAGHSINPEAIASDSWLIAKAMVEENK